MNVSFDYERLLPLLSSLYTLTGIRADLYDLDFAEVCINEELAPPFCALINGIPEGHERCVQCDRDAKSRARSGRPVFYRCHAGICESILSIGQSGMPLAYMFCGQYLDDSDPEQQWEQTKKTLEWYPGDLETLHQAFLQFRSYSDQEIRAYAEILTALARYIQLEGIIRSSEQTDIQRLAAYIDQHFTEKLSLDSVAAELQIGRTKLCALAKELSGGSTLSKMITARRIEAAKERLRQGDEPVSAVAEAVGISDYNYFTKVFRSSTGMTPSDYRRSMRGRTIPKGTEAV